ncbi:YXWGXW repeat-containing protein [Andreprevotia chitinilytica]|uniref:YXWGXW repeat-containing protein n=1 Tax=Andreprevotia chitinilytica TaxID=396808 RepID=UPI000552FBF3|nr:YXWGXW repeat-containing protein [Andreprevotia chitinilytica]
MKKTLCTALVCSAALLGALSGCATHERVVVHETVVERPVIRAMPAPIHEERGNPPGRGWNWVPGHWKWEGHDWVWAHGNWVQQEVAPMPPIIVEQITIAPSPRHFWVPGHWRWDMGGWVWIKGSWHS